MLFRGKRPDDNDGENEAKRTAAAVATAKLFLNRLQWGLNAVLAQLRATGPWRAILGDILAIPIEPAPT